jgi:hypothetical protein
MLASFTKFANVPSWPLLVDDMIVDGTKTMIIDAWAGFAVVQLQNGNFGTPDQLRFAAPKKKEVPAVQPSSLAVSMMTLSL